MIPTDLKEAPVSKSIDRTHSETADSPTNLGLFCGYFDAESKTPGRASIWISDNEAEIFEASRCYAQSQGEIARENWKLGQIEFGLGGLVRLLRSKSGSGDMCDDMTEARVKIFDLVGLRRDLNGVNIGYRALVGRALASIRLPTLPDIIEYDEVRDRIFRKAIPDEGKARDFVHVTTAVENRYLEVLSSASKVFSDLKDSQEFSRDLVKLYVDMLPLSSGHSKQRVIKRISDERRDYWEERLQRIYG